MMTKLFAALLLLVLVSPAEAERLTWKTETRFWENLVELTSVRVVTIFSFVTV
jgi:hypothetical protein